MSPIYKKIAINVLSWVLLLSTGLLVKPQAAHACSCVAPPSSAEQYVKDELGRRSAIFAGTVLQITPPRQKIFMSSADLVMVTFEVATVWKGELGHKANVYTAQSSASCGVDSFKVGMKYIVSAYEDSKPLVTNICSLTKQLSTAGAELAALGEGYAPSKVMPEKKLGTPPVSSLLVVLVIIIGGAIVWMRYRRRGKE